MKLFSILLASAAVILMSSCTTVVEKPEPTVSTEVRTRHTETSTPYSPIAPAMSTTTETRSLRAE